MNMSVAVIAVPGLCLVSGHLSRASLNPKLTINVTIRYDGREFNVDSIKSRVWSS